VTVARVPNIRTDPRNNGEGLNQNNNSTTLPPAGLAVTEQ